jgi:NADH-quinone oxidoreductase subunit C
LLHCLAQNLIKEIIWNSNEIEIKTTADLVEELLWLLKYMTLNQFEQVVELVAIDLPRKEQRFKIVIILRSLQYNLTIALSYTINTTRPVVKSIAYLYKSAGWLEREVWDMFGINFIGNNDLRRILTDYGFQGHPLRKDFPLSGFHEVYYDDSYKRLLYESVELSQEYRTFNFRNDNSFSFTKLQI